MQEGKQKFECTRRQKPEAWSRDAELSGLATSYEFSGWERNLDTSVWIRHSRTLNASLRNLFIEQWGFFGYLWTKNKKEAAHQSTIFLPLSLTQCHILSFVPEEGGPSCVSDNCSVLHYTEQLQTSATGPSKPGETRPPRRLSLTKPSELQGVLRARGLLPNLIKVLDRMLSIKSARLGFLCFSKV